MYWIFQKSDREYLLAEKVFNFRFGKFKMAVFFRIKKILKVDQPVVWQAFTVAEPRGITPTLFRPKSRKSNFPYSTPLSVNRLTSPLIFRGENMEPRGRASRNSLD